MKTLALLTLVLLSVTALTAQTHSFKPGANRISFLSEGENVVGILFLPANYQPGQRLAAVIVEGPWTQVKEQVGYRYGQKLAEQGFAALAFDHRNFGESAGKVRQYESPTMKLQDLKAAVTYLQSLPAIDGERIGGLGVCFGASYMANLMAEDKRLKSFATVAAWFHDDASIKATYTPAGYAQRLAAGQEAMKRYRQNGQVDVVLGYSATDKNAAMQGSFDYYSNPQRGAIPQWKNEFATLSWEAWLKYDAVNPFAPRITVPTLLVHSDESALPDNVRTFHNLLKGSKDLLWSQGQHVDFYDKEPLVAKAATAVAGHFKHTL